jgi:hypothetical protein
MTSHGIEQDESGISNLSNLMQLAIPPRQQVKCLKVRWSNSAFVSGDAPSMNRYNTSKQPELQFNQTLTAHVIVTRWKSRIGFNFIKHQKHHTFTHELFHEQRLNQL